MANLLRLVAILAAVWIVLSLVRHAMATRRKADKSSRRNGEDMVRCVRCGVHVPRSEAILRGSEFFCSEHHSAAGQ